MVCLEYLVTLSGVYINTVLHYGQSILEDKLIKQYETHSSLSLEFCLNLKCIINQVKLVAPDLLLITGFESQYFRGWERNMAATTFASSK